MVLLKTFRRITLAEGISLLLLLFVAMPLKYLMGMPEVVKVVGWIHGVLFMVYVVVLVVLNVAQRWSYIFFVGAFLASIIPFGTFVLDRELRKKQNEVAA